MANSELSLDWTAQKTSKREIIDSPHENITLLVSDRYADNRNNCLWQQPRLWLCDEEMETFSRLSVAKRKIEWLRGRRCGKDLFRRSLTDVRATTIDYRAIKIDARSSGVPTISVIVPGKTNEKSSWSPSNISFSLSHRQRMTAAAMSVLPLENGPKGDSQISLVKGLGIDIELIEPRPTLFADTFFHPIEIAELTRIPHSERMVMETIIWSMKEAILKATTEGLRRGTSSFSLRFAEMATDEWSSLSFSDPGPFKAISVLLFARRCDDFIISLAVINSSGLINREYSHDDKK